MAKGGSSWLMLVGLGAVALYLASKNNLLAKSGGAADTPGNPVVSYPWGWSAPLNYNSANPWSIANPVHDPNGGGVLLDPVNNPMVQFPDGVGDGAMFINYVGSVWARVSGPPPSSIKGWRRVKQ